MQTPRERFAIEGLVAPGFEPVRRAFARLARLRGAGVPLRFALTTFNPSAQLPAPPVREAVYKVIR
jgi:hypothetical protein